MSVHLIAILTLLVVFVLGTLRPVNLGALALVAAFAVGELVAGEDSKTVLSGFPPDLFVLLFGVTYLFGIASVNGTIEWLVNSLARVVGNRIVLMPWIIFLVSAIPTTVGALGPAAVAMLAPIALRLGKKYDINLRLIGLMAMHGSSAGNFSPVNALGAIVNGTVQRNGLPTHPLALFVANFAYNMILAVAIYLIFGGLELKRRTRALEAVSVGVADEGVLRSFGGSARSDRVGGAATTMLAESQSEPLAGMTKVRAVTLAGIIAVAAGALAFKFDLGTLAVACAVLLHLSFPSTSKGALNKVSWSTVLLICGIITYMTLLQRTGTITMIGNSVAALRTPVFGALLICAIAALTSAFASSAGILSALIPLSVPLLKTGAVGVGGFVIALAISATVVDSMPFSNVGAMVLANCPETDYDRLFRGMIVWGLAMVLTAPVATWLLFVLPS
jgi:di/tricarboxylate transporter